MRIVTMSDTHTYGPRVQVPDGDILIHAGDHTFRGNETEIKNALKWLESLPHKHKLLIAGNHDWFFDPNAPKQFNGWSLNPYYTVPQMMAKYPSLTYLCDSSVEIDGLKFYGSPWQPWYYGWGFNFAQGEKGRHQAQNTWAKIPTDTNVLITHSPPYGILDATLPDDERNGCPQLRARLDDLPLLRLHVFGHLHESYGRRDYEATDGSKLTFVNAAINTRAYEPTNAPIIVDLEPALDKAA